MTGESVVGRRRPSSGISTYARTLGRSTAMIGVFVTFRYGDNFDEQAVRKIAETARARFEGMPGLRSKAFTVNSGKREAVNFYVWDSEEAAKAFFTDQLLERVAGPYGGLTLAGWLLSGSDAQSKEITR